MGLVNGTIYTPDYTVEDSAPIVVDTGLKIIIGVATFATLIGLGIGLSYLAKIYNKLK